MKKYLVDLHRLRHNPYNGLYTFCCRLAENLLNQPLNDEEMYYYLPKDKFGMFGPKASYVTHLRLHKLYQLNTSRFDVWHLTTGISQYGPFNTRTKVVYTIHDVNFLVEEPDNHKRNKRSLNLMQRNARRADHIVCISQYALDFAAQHLIFGSTPTSVIHNGYTVSEFPGFDEPVYRPQRPFLFTLSLVQPRKNFHVLPALLEGNDYELVIAGLNDFPYADTVRAEARRWKVEDRVKLIGPIDEKSKYWYLKHCDAFVFPSIAEGFGAPPLEAMHFGKPVFLSRYMSLPEIGGTVAYYFENFDPGEMSRAFHAGMADYRQFDRSESIRAQAAKFNWNHTAASYLDIYRQLAAK